MTVFGITVPVAVVIAVGVIAAALIVRAAVVAVRRRVRRSAGTLAGIGYLISAAKQAAKEESEDETKPRSLSGGDSLYLPLIKKDFPDFSVTAAKEAVRAKVKEQYGDAEGFRIHRAALCDYLRSGGEKTAVFQCAYELRKEGKLRQHRAVVHYTHRQLSGEDYAAQSCPACGAAIRPGDTQCAYCGSRLVMTRAAWEITDCFEG